MFKFVSRRTTTTYFISWEWIAPWDGKTYKDSEFFVFRQVPQDTKSIREKISLDYLAVDGENIPASHITITAVSKL